MLSKVEVICDCVERTGFANRRVNQYLFI